ncbi:MAG: hypothetical protein M3R21_00275, partial [Candidatus Dormibacteraeota bacterium]|nr:hypothetical protein [Candidatus Dormibacteraeota bacterium]
MPEHIHSPMLHSATMTRAHRRLGWLAGAFILLALVIAGWVALASGLLAPAPSTDPVALLSPTAAVQSALPRPSPSTATTPSPSPELPRGIVATRVVIPRLKIDLPIYEGDGYT